MSFILKTVSLVDGVYLELTSGVVLNSIYLNYSQKKPHLFHELCICMLFRSLYKTFAFGCLRAQCVSPRRLTCTRFWRVFSTPGTPSINTPLSRLERTTQNEFRKESMRKLRREKYFLAPQRAISTPPRVFRASPYLPLKTSRITSTLLETHGRDDVPRVIFISGVQECCRALECTLSPPRRRCGFVIIFVRFTSVKGTSRHF